MNLCVSSLVEKAFKFNGVPQTSCRRYRQFVKAGMTIFESTREKHAGQIFLGTEVFVQQARVLLVRAYAPARRGFRPQGREVQRLNPELPYWLGYCCSNHAFFNRAIPSTISFSLNILKPIRIKFSRQRSFLCQYGSVGYTRTLCSLAFSINHSCFSP